jgi:hypothetical protein
VLLCRCSFREKLDGERRQSALDLNGDAREATSRRQSNRMEQTILQNTVITRKLTGLFSVAVLLATLPVTALAKDKEKSYPETGKVIGKGQNSHTHQNSGGHGDFTKYTNTYKIETSTEVLELDCGKEAIFHREGKECGGDHPLTIGGDVQFRVEKHHVFIPLSNGSEQKLEILSEEAKPETAAQK